VGALVGLLSFTKPPEGFEAPGTEIFETHCVIGSGDYCVNRASLLMILASVIVVALFLIAFRRPKLVPTGIQNAMESVVEFVRNGIALEVMGHDGLPWVPFLTTMFMFIFVNNIFEILPLIHFPTTSRMAIPLFLALVTYVIFMFLGFKKNKFRYLIESAPALIVHGHIERQERSVNVIAESFEPLAMISDAGRRVHTFG